MNSTKRPKRSLILAGGGIKVAFQAGVLQVWLDEANIPFDHVDGASGGTFNLAMLCQGMSGQQIADNWRTMPPLGSVSFNWGEYLKLFFARSLLTLDGFRDTVLPHWGIDWDVIKASQLDATFNVYNFTRHELEVLSPAQMSEQFLLACVSLPMWFPPVEINDNTYIDPVFVTDANIEEAIKRGADEIWVIWTVSEHQDWGDGFLANYFQILESSANGHFKRICKRIEENNAARVAGGDGEFGRTIKLELLKAEVPLHYLINFSNDRLREAVDRGVQVARAWCREHAIPLGEKAEYTRADLTQLTFRETMRGTLRSLARSVGDRELPDASAASEFALDLTITIDGVQRFVADAAHEGHIDGLVRWAAIGEDLQVVRGWFNLLVDDPDRPNDLRSKQMRYLLYLRDNQGQEQTLVGIKEVRDDPGFDLWKDTTTLRVWLLPGHITPDDREPWEVLAHAEGVATISGMDLLRMLRSIQVDGPGLRERTAAVRDFLAFFLGRLWDVYANKVLPYAPF